MQVSLWTCRYWAEAVRNGSSASEPAPTERMLTMMQFVLRVGPEAFVETGCLDTILMVRLPQHYAQQL